MHNAIDSCLELTKILSAISQANVGQPINRRVSDAEGLGIKFIFHSISAQHLIRGTRLPEIGANFNDPASINVIIRAAVESVLTFYYVFVSGSSEDELAFRHDSWVMSDLQKRQKFPVSMEESKLRLVQDKELIGKIAERLRANPHLKTLEAHQQKAVLQGREWRFAGWADIGLAMGLDNNHARVFYGYLCSYAHSGYWSVLQVQQAKTAADQKMLSDGSAGILAVSSAHMIALYAKMFPQCADVLRQMPDAERIVKLWITIGASTA